MQGRLEITAPTGPSGVRGRPFQLRSAGLRGVPAVGAGEDFLRGERGGLLGGQRLGPFHAGGVVGAGAGAAILGVEGR